MMSTEERMFELILKKRFAIGSTRYKKVKKIDLHRCSAEFAGTVCNTNTIIQI